MPLDSYVTLGRSGLKVSPFCLGAMTFGQEWGFGADESTAKRMMDRFFELGGNFIDTANMYTGGHSERIIGDHLGRDPLKRDRVVIATKFSGNMISKDPNGGGASRKSIFAACEASLRRLQTDYIDLYWLHWEDPYTPIEETIGAMNALVDAGKVRYIGFSDTHAWKIARAQTIAEFRGWSPLIALQIEYSLLERTVEGELMPMAQALGLGVTPWSPLRGGMLSGKYARGAQQAESPGRQQVLERNLNEETFKVLDVLKEVARRQETTASRVALAWVLSRAGVSSPILGVRTEAQLEDNLAALEVKLLPEHIKLLDDASAPRLNFPSQFLPAAVRAAYSGVTVNGQSFVKHPLV
jgi:aryl-alcohol dehydrogenase-like predicted oxidoreductase